MPARQAVVLVHDTDPDRGHREVGSVGGALVAAGLDVDVATLVGPSTGLLTELPDPVGLRALVVMGAAAAAYDDRVPWLAAELGYLRRAVDAQVPVLGACFGGQVLARVLGGTVRRAAEGEHGFTEITTYAPDLVPTGPWMEFHSDTFTTPPGAVTPARTDRAVQAFRAGPHLGVQFHPEITPGAFDAWVESWELTGEIAAVQAAGIDIASLRKDVARRADAAAAACIRLVAAFLAADNAYC